MKNFYLLFTLLFAASAVHAQVLLDEDFEGGSLPAGWSQQTVASDGGWLFGTVAAMSSAYWGPADNGSMVAATNDDACNCDKSNDKLIMPAFDLSGAAGAILSFDAVFARGSYAGAQELGFIEASTDGGASWATVEEIFGEDLDWHSHTIDLSAYAGMSNVMLAFRYDDGGGWTFGFMIDNVSVFVPLPDDAELTSISTASYQAIGNNVDIMGTVTNVGANAITSMDITWSDGTNSYTDNLTGLNIAPLTTYDFTHSAQFPVVAGATTISVDVSNVNGMADSDPANNMGSVDIFGVPFIPNRGIVMEEGTGTWCGWCPRGHVAMAYMQETYPETFLGVAVHNSDPMADATYDAAFGGLIGGYPSGAAERAPGWIDIDPTDFEAAHNVLINEVAPAEVTFSNIAYDPGTRTVTADLSAEFVVDLEGDYRLNVIVIEDGVTGTASGYAQANYYSSATNDIPLTGAGHDWQAEPDPVPAADMVYDHVGRAILGGFTGMAGSLPANIASGDIASYTFTATFPADWNAENIHLIGMLQDNNDPNGRILNGVLGEMPASVSNVELLAENVVEVFPNPAGDMAFVKVELEDASDVTLQIFNNLGQMVLNRDFGQLSGDMVLPVHTNDFSTGLYNVHVNVNGKIITKKLMIAR